MSARPSNLISVKLCKSAGGGEQKAQFTRRLLLRARISIDQLRCVLWNACTIEHTHVARAQVSMNVNQLLWILECTRRGIKEISSTLPTRQSIHLSHTHGECRWARIKPVRRYMRTDAFNGIYWRSLHLHEKRCCCHSARFSVIRNKRPEST